MEERVKRKVYLNIAGISMSLITDEPDSYVKSIEKKLDEHMTELLRNVKVSQFDAAMLSALEFCGDKLTAEKKLRNLEAQVSLYEVNLRRLKNEVASLKAQLGETETPAEEKADDTVDAIPDEQITIDEGMEQDEKPASRSDKLRMIESLLKKN
ncbi:MAG: cell division protein ZapA [Clostridia bacterium]|nr:cell division protein ZapA [Clostridia bacterium]